ncbi:tRNA lysidine(34) synthetase TilS [Sulfurirhabdus autotrophica]|uniref:tRNA(Ile)-lysidine synthase n=1 Tax=Sulfurirhabdus autotrophica TaxID=1706046 RepID=A0A4V2W2B3_9PROT|nr:tRNA lysidine(34) synthetase TilS [Sulfurirhabdus autotrophica]TCV87409.1 tRNA(Ile)-lysidine synthase [Sulfurirhabdus autotrophica]
MASSKKQLLSDLPPNVKSILESWVNPGHRLVLGLSGGIDSVVLLDILSQLQSSLDFQLSAVHINHQLSPFASNWATFCQQLCNHYQVPLQLVPVDLNRESGCSLEAVAREARYAEYFKQDVDFVVLAQHLDDQAETLLLQLLRGTGMKGSSAMPVARVCKSGATILRPLLKSTRKEIESYAELHHLRWVEDESNENVAFDRNFLRHKVFPVFEQRFPAYRQTFLRFSQHFAEASELLDDLAAIDAQHSIVEGRLQLESVRDLSNVRAKNVLRYFLGCMGISMPSADRLSEMLRQLLDAAKDANVRIVLGDNEIRRFKNQAYVCQKTKKGQVELCWTWQGESELKLSGIAGTLIFEKVVGQGISMDKLLSDNVLIRLRRGGERLRPDCLRPRRTLKNLYQEKQIPPWKREAQPLMYSGENLVWAAEFGVDCSYQAQDGEPGLIVKLKN